ncbi:hypothetical protein MUP59_11695 [Candidatus Bathyarchaeota archaeon]|nr:hypothetical protein [Candidatus Bathyarchaeota archaeon]
MTLSHFEDTDIYLNHQEDGNKERLHDFLAELAAISKEEYNEYRNCNDDFLDSYDYE